VVEENPVHEGHTVIRNHTSALLKERHDFNYDIIYYTINNSECIWSSNGSQAASESSSAAQGIVITTTVTSLNPGYLRQERHFLENEDYDFSTKKPFNVINFPKKVKNIRILGLMALISYMIVILFTWIYANFNGYVYFMAGEPNIVIKYTEWVLGFAGIIVAADFLRKEMNEIA